jgi:hypothetical protein
MEPTTGFEPVTSSLPKTRSTPELRGLGWWGEQDSNLRRRPPPDLQSGPFGRSGIPPRTQDYTHCAVGDVKRCGRVFENWEHHHPP